ncbi:MAG: transcription termination/antitermination factor NusG [Flavobacteriaceae bacterium]|jgi:transcriptional antiterminator NusG|nr:transcription termination/antitermination factor NusG [Flavobacteriaceae bacterium]PHX84540.1 MAG: transcription termination/antitermination factor NusG [Flavobacteriales bacterium]
MTAEGMKWYVVRAISGQENKTKAHIEQEMQRMGMMPLLGQVLIPTEKVYQIRNGKKVLKERNFFPGYIMFEGILTGELIHVLKNIPNVIGFLGQTKGGDPTPLRISEVNRMLGKVDELAESAEHMSVPFVIGESVKVIDGPFRDFNGTVEKIHEDKRKLEVMVKIFGRKTPLELGFMQVEKEN